MRGSREVVVQCSKSGVKCKEFDTGLKVKLRKRYLQVLFSLRRDNPSCYRVFLLIDLGFVGRLKLSN